MPPATSPRPSATGGRRVRRPASGRLRADARAGLGALVACGPRCVMARAGRAGLRRAARPSPRARLARGRAGVLRLGGCVAADRRGVGTRGPRRRGVALPWGDEWSFAARIRSGGSSRTGPRARCRWTRSLPTCWPHNVVGNVWEWTAERSLRGGSYLCDPSYCDRKQLSGRTEGDMPMGHIGFRVSSAPWPSWRGPGHPGVRSAPRRAKRPNDNAGGLGERDRARRRGGRPRLRRPGRRCGRRAGRDRAGDECCHRGGRRPRRRMMFIVDMEHSSSRSGSDRRNWTIVRPISAHEPRDDAAQLIRGGGEALGGGGDLLGGRGGLLGGGRDLLG